MGFNPCGRIVDLLQDAYTDTIKPYAGADLEVTRRWYRVGDDVPTLGIPSAFLSEFSEAFPYLERAAGFVWPSARDTTRRFAPGGLTYDHVCGTAADFAGQGVFDPTRNVVYDDSWIPECCGATDVCVFQLCSQDEENGFQAGQLRSYPVPHQVATGSTPVVIDHWAQNLGNDPAGWPGYGFDWYPAGEDGDLARQLQVVADENGNLQFQVDRWNFSELEAITQTINATGYGLDFALAGDVGGLALEFVGGVLTLTGTNLLVAKSVLPPDIAYRDGAGLFGSALATATQVPPGAHLLHSVTTLTRFFQLIDTPAAVVDVYPSDAVGAFGAVLFPPLGQAFNGLAVNAFFAMTNAAAPYFAWRFVRVIHPITGLVNWNVLKYRADGTTFNGTVTSVDISTSSTGVTVGGGPIVGAGTLTVNLDTAIQDVVAVASVDGIIAGDGAGGLLTITIGDWLSYSGGVLDVVPPTATSGHKLCSTFAITGTTGTFQATGDTFTLPTAGTYLITGRVRGGVQGANLVISRIEAKLRNTTAGADVTDSTVMCVRNQSSAVTGEGTAGFSATITVAGASVIELYAARVGTTWTFSSIISDADGQTAFDWVRLS